MKILQLLEDTLNEKPKGLSDEQGEEWNLVQIKVYNEIAEKKGWERNSSVYISNFFKFGEIFADKYDGNFNKIHSLSGENKKELEKLLMEKLS